MFGNQVTRDDILTGPVGWTLVRLAIPMVVGILSVVAFNIADAYFIGKLGAHELAAISFTFPLTFFYLSLAMGLSVGTTAILAQVIGAGDPTEVQTLTTHGLLLSIFAVLLVMGVGLATLDPALTLMGAEADLKALVKPYLKIWFLGLGLLYVSMVGNGAMRATGDTMSPSIVMAVAGGVNVLLDPVLIFGWGPIPELGLEGAAYATLISWIFTLITALGLLYRRDLIQSSISFAWSSLLKSWQRVLYVAVPMAATNVLGPLSTAFLTRLVAWKNPEAVAAFGIGTRVEALALVGVLALSNAITAFVGQNWGAEQCDRIREATRFGMVFALIWGSVMWIVLWLCRYPLAGLFSEAPTIISVSAYFFALAPLGYSGFGVTVVVSAVYIGLRQPFPASKLTGFRLFVFGLPLSALVAWVAGLPGLFGGMALGNTLAAIVAYRWVSPYLARVEDEPIVDRYVIQSPASLCEECF